MTDISLTKTIAVLSARPTDRAEVLRALAARIRASGLHPVLVDDTEPAEPTVERLRRADWSTTFDTVVDACARERRARLAATMADVLLVGGAALHALARYRAGLALRGDEFDAAIRSWLEGPATGAAARYDAVLHVRPEGAARRGERLVDHELASLLERLDIPRGAIFRTLVKSDVHHTVRVVSDALGLGGAVTSSGRGWSAG